MDTIAFKNQTLTLIDGKKLTITGIKDIIGFTEGEILLDGIGGKITVEGDDLKIESLSKDEGNILITGEISGIFRSLEKSQKKWFFAK